MCGPTGECWTSYDFSRSKLAASYIQSEHDRNDAGRRRELFCRRLYRPVAIEGRPVWNHGFLIRVVHRSEDRTNLSLLNEKPFAQEISPHGDTGFSLKKHDAQDRLRFFIDDGIASRRHSKNVGHGAFGGTVGKTST